MDFTSRYIGIKELSKKLSISAHTLRRWEKEGKISSIRTSGNHRRYDPEKVFKEINFIDQELKKDFEIVSCCYARVSTREQISDLKRQKEMLELFCSSKGLKFMVVDDIGSGLNYKRPGLSKIIDLVLNQKIDKLIITHKDRIVRFGLEIIQQLCDKHNVEIIIINNEEEKTDNQKEFVEDVLSVVTHFSSLLYGKRSHKNKKILEENKKLFKEIKEIK